MYSIIPKVCVPYSNLSDDLSKLILGNSKNVNIHKLMPTCITIFDEYENISMILKKLLKIREACFSCIWGNVISSKQYVQGSS